MDKIINKIDFEEELITNCWKNFVIGDIENAMKLLFQMFSDIELIIAEVNLIKEKESLSIKVDDIFDIFICLEEAMKSSNYCLIADLIIYEIKPKIHKWKEVLLKL